MKSELEIVAIAEICHETNRLYCDSIGDHSQVRWRKASLWQRDSAISGVKHHLQTLESGGEPDPAEAHENWLREKLENGWRYGPVKDPAIKEHPCCVPYDKLPEAQKRKDVLFIAIVKAFTTAV